MALLRPIKNRIAHIAWRFLFPRYSKFGDDINTAFVGCVHQIEKFSDEELKYLCADWLCVRPHTLLCIVSGLEPNPTEGFKTLVRLFRNADALDGRECFKVSQGYFLRHLRQLIKQNPNYETYSLDSLNKNVIEHLDGGEEICALAEKFEKEVDNILDMRDFAMCYVDQLLLVLYPEIEKAKAYSVGLRVDSQFQLELCIRTQYTILDIEEGDSEKLS